MWRTNLRILGLALCVVGFYTGIAHVIPQLQSEVPEALALTSDVTPEALASAGEKVFNGAGGCTTCHGLGTRAPNLLTDHAGQGPIGARCGSREPGKDCKSYLHESLVKPAAYIVPGFEPIMPDMSRQLSPDQLWAVVAYLQSQGGEVTVTGSDLQPAAGAGAAPTPAAAAGGALTATLDPVQLYNEKGCVGCHQLGGKGGRWDRRSITSEPAGPPNTCAAPSWSPTPTRPRALRSSRAPCRPPSASSSRPRSSRRW